MTKQRFTTRPASALALLLVAACTSGAPDAGFIVEQADATALRGHYIGDDGSSIDVAVTAAAGGRHVSLRDDAGTAIADWNVDDATGTISGSVGARAFTIAMLPAGDAADEEATVPVSSAGFEAAFVGSPAARTIGRVLGAVEDQHLDDNAVVVAHLNALGALASAGAPPVAPHAAVAPPQIPGQTCSDAALRVQQRAVDAACKIRNARYACKGTDSCSTLRTIRDRNASCHDRRAHLQIVCFGGSWNVPGGPGHKQELENVTKRLNACTRFLANNGCAIIIPI